MQEKPERESETRETEKHTERKKEREREREQAREICSRMFGVEHVHLHWSGRTFPCPMEHWVPSGNVDSALLDPGAINAAAMSSTAQPTSKRDAAGKSKIPHTLDPKP